MDSPSRANDVRRVVRTGTARYGRRQVTLTVAFVPFKRFLDVYINVQSGNAVLPLNSLESFRDLFRSAPSCGMASKQFDSISIEIVPGVVHSQIVCTDFK